MLQRSIPAISIILLSWPMAHSQEDSHRLPFAYSATVQLLSESTPKDAARFNVNFVSAYSHRNAIALSMRPKLGNSSLDVFSDSAGFFSLDFTIKEVPQGDILNFLSKAKFDRTAYSQSQFRSIKDFTKIVDRFSFHIVPMLCTGQCAGVLLSQKQYRELVVSCPNDGSLSTHAPSNHMPTDVSVTKIGGRLSKVSIKNKNEESVGTYDTPIDSPNVSFTATILVINKNYPNGLKMKLTKHATITSEKEVQRILGGLLAAIPAKTKLVLGESDDQIPQEWNGTSFVPLVLPESIRTANDQRLAARQGGTIYYAIATSILLAVVVLIVFWKWKKSRSLGLALLVLVTLQNRGQAQTADGPYCGLYCVTAAAAAMDCPLRFEHIRTRDYLSANPGSTTEDLVRALEFAKLNAIVHRHLSVSQLRSADGPVILHVRSPGATNFKHWCLFLGFTDFGHVLIYDPPFEQKVIPVAEMMAVWDGFGIEVSSIPNGSISVISWDWLIFTVVLGFVFWLSRRWYPAKYAIPITAVVVALAWGLMPQAIIGKTGPRGLVSANYFMQSVPELPYEHIRDLMDTQNVVFVDSRVYESHLAVRIPHSLNVPVNAGLVQLRETMNAVRKDCYIICYCNSEHCDWSDIVANQLSHMGYSKVGIYRGGIKDWLARKLPVDR
jgi:rhodanese-related sulfurtransferase